MNCYITSVQYYHANRSWEVRISTDTSNDILVDIYENITKIKNINNDIEFKHTDYIENFNFNFFNFNEIVYYINTYLLIIIEKYIMLDIMQMIGLLKNDTLNNILTPSISMKDMNNIDHMFNEIEEILSNFTALIDPFKLDDNSVVSYNIVDNYVLYNNYDNYSRNLYKLLLAHVKYEGNQFSYKTMSLLIKNTSNDDIIDTVMILMTNHDVGMLRSYFNQYYTELFRHTELSFYGFE